MPTEPIPNPRPRGSPPAGGVGESNSVGDPAGDRPPPGQQFVLSPSGTSVLPLAGLPREIGPYQIQRVIGSGGMATVYAALQKQPRRTVALKVMKAGIAQSRGEAALRRFKREIEILGKLHHPFIAAVYDAGTFDDGTGGGPAPYFVMEYIPGALNILEYIAKKEMDLRDRLKLFVKVCAAVEHGHSHKVIHRDLKPGNILIDQYGEPKIIDFGIAHAAEVDASQQTLTTEAGNLVGTLQYMAPEQVDTRPQDLDGRCDVYALGVLLYKMTTGKPPYDLEALPVFEAIRIIREEQPRRPSEINSEVKGDLETIILKSMERDRGRRYRNAGSLGRDIVRFLANKPINARPASMAYRFSLFVKRNAAVLGVVATIAFIALAALGYTTWERQRIKRQQAQQAGAIAKKEQELDQRQADVEAARIAATQGGAGAKPDEPFKLAQHTSRITQLRFVPTAGGHPLLASASLDRQLLVWDVESRRLLQRVEPFNKPIAFMAVSADGSTVAVAGDGEGDPIAIVRCIDGQVIRTIKDTGGSVKSLGLGPSGEIVAWGSSNLTLNLRATEARGPMARDNPLREPRSMRSSIGAFTALATSMNDRFVAAGAASGAVLVWEPVSPPILPTAPSTAAEGRRDAARDAGPVRLTGLSQPIVAITFIEREVRRGLIAIAENGDAFIWWNDSTGWQGSGWSVAGMPIIAANFSPNASRLVVLTADGAQMWAIGDGATAPQRIGSSIKLDDTPSAAAIDDAGQWIALGMANGDVAMHPTQK